MPTADRPPGGQMGSLKPPDTSGAADNRQRAGEGRQTNGKVVAAQTVSVKQSLIGIDCQNEGMHPIQRVPSPPPLSFSM